MWPLVLFEGGDLTMYANYADLNGYVEAVDVDNGEYEAFDSAGRPIDLSTEGGPKEYGRPVLVGVREGVPLEVDSLTARLRGHVQGLASARAAWPNFESDSLSELIEGLMPFYREPRQRRRRP